MNTPFKDRLPPGPRRDPRAGSPFGRRDHDLPTRLARARLVFLLGRGRPLFDWIALSLAALAVTILLGADLDGRQPPPADPAAASAGGAAGLTRARS